ncbi:MAG: AAA family ATPase [Aristaeellaceae bacterium]
MTYCILVAGPPASGKTTLARALSARLALPVFAKDRIKERLFDTLGFASRAEKVRLGDAAAAILWDCAGELMRLGRPFILENNFEDATRPALMALLEENACTALTILLTGDPQALYRRFAARDMSPERHRGHVVNDRYPEAGDAPPHPASALTFEGYVDGIARRGMDRFIANGPRLVVDATDPAGVDADAIAAWIRAQLPR